MNTSSAPIPLHFSLASNVYAATFEQAIIILDGTSDKYISLVDDAAVFFSLILKNAFVHQNDGLYYPVCADQPDKNNNYDYWIRYFIEKKFITQGSGTTHLAGPLQSGGLVGYRWDIKKSWKPFSVAPIMDTVRAFFVLARVHRIIKRKGILGVIMLIKKSASSVQATIPSAQEIEKLSASVDAASLLYPKKTLCLAWATTFVVLALRKKWQMNFVIGVQTNPFYAHAWAETVSGTVINDDPLIAQALSVIFKQPYC
jgi:hypothetical protein